MITRTLDTNKPKFRIIEDRFFEAPRDILTEISRTLLIWNTQPSEYLNLAQNYNEIFGMSNEAVLEALAVFQDGWNREVFYIPEEGTSRGTYIVSSHSTYMDEYDREAFIMGYMRASMFAATVLVYDGSEVSENSDIRTLDQLGWHGPTDLSDEVEEDLRSEADNVLERLLADPDAYAEALDSVTTPSASTTIQRTVWERHGTNAYYTRNGHGTGFWDQPRDSMALHEMNRWARDLGESGGWVWDVRFETLDFNPVIVD